MQNSQIRCLLLILERLDNFCEYRNLGHDNYKSLLLSYSDASNKFGPLEFKKVIEKSENFIVTAVAIAAIKCPQHIVK